MGSRLNVVGELPEGGCIPAADFKSVLGGDLLSARQPTKPVVTFRNEAAHVFTSNHLISTRDHSEADRIIDQELPGIMHWALQGGERLLKQGHFSKSRVHDRLMEKWRRSSNSLDEFIHECCTSEPALYERRSHFYAAYKRWCSENTRKPHANSRVKELMEHRVGLKVRFAVLDGYDVIRGIAVNEAYKDHLTSL